MTELKGAVIAVTGASKGFGLAMVQQLVAAGARVGMLARTEKDLQAAAAEFPKDQVLAIACDIADKSALTQALRSIKQHFSAFNGLVNNAGLARPSSVEHLDETELMLQVNTNFVGTVLACQAAIPLLRGQDNPRIINISSASAWHYDEMLHLSIYAATKAAVERFSRDLRQECQADGIGVSCVRPGAAWTDFAGGWDEEKLAAGIRAWADTGPYMDIGMEVEQVASAVLHCLSCPPGVAVDLLEVRPNQRVPKMAYDSEEQ